MKKTAAAHLPFAGLMASLLAGLLAGSLAGCARRPITQVPPDPWQIWQAKRLDSVAGTNGWATLAGLLWLREGPNTLGSAVASPLVLPAGSAPARAGVVVREGKHARFLAAPGVEAALDGLAITNALLRSDADGAQPSVLTLGALRLTVIQRGERLGLRVKDPFAPTRVHFRGLDYFPHDPRWRVEGRFEPAPSPRTLAISDVTGTENQEPSPGSLVFTVAGQEHRLDALTDEETHDLFILFRDRTAGNSTYGAGRFLHVALPGPDGRVVLDFNYAYNPPCAFTSFATCPLPPRQNWLPFPIEAGERKYRGGHE